MRKRKITPLTVKKYREKRSDPVGRIVRRHLEEMVESSDLTTEEILENLKKFGKTYSSEKAFKIMILRSTINLRTFIRIMLALDIKSFNINLSDEEADVVALYESLKDD